ncbi:MAG: NrfD/PsrC family molybdoenzyme membrane anchor subunit [Candidatus Rokuibacteriota bacterium]
MTPPPSTLFTTAPEWHWLIVGYFFVGGLAGGCYFLAVLIDFMGTREDRALARMGYYVALPAIVVSGILLILDLTRPERFWHMLLQSETWRPMFKYWSPMSVGSWALPVFGFFALLSFLAALSEAGTLRRPALTALRPPRPLGCVVAVLGGLLGFYVAGYTGVLLAVTNRPIWSDTPLLGPLFVVSAASVSAALLILLGAGRGLGVPGLAALERFDAWVIGLELLVLIALMISLGGLFRFWLSPWGVLLVAVVIFGMALPLLFRRRPGAFGGREASISAGLVLIAGFLLRVVIVFSSEAL